MMKTALAILGLALLLSACGSTPESSYYLLSADAPGTPSGLEPSIGIGPVSVPVYLDRKQLVRLQGSNQVRVLEYQRWAEPLDRGITRVLALNLAALLDTQVVVTFPWRHEARPDYAVRVAVARFHASRGQVILEAQWSARALSGDGQPRQHVSRLSAALQGDSEEELVVLHSDLLRELCEEIAAAIRELQAESLAPVEA